jgi:hypothetical protein
MNGILMLTNNELISRVKMRLCIAENPSKQYMYEAMQVRSAPVATSSQER